MKSEWAMIKICNLYAVYSLFKKRPLFSLKGLFLAIQIFIEWTYRSVYFS